MSERGLTHYLEKFQRLTDVYLLWWSTVELRSCSRSIPLFNRHESLL